LQQSFTDDSSLYSSSRAPPGGGSYSRRGREPTSQAIRPSNRAAGNISSDASTITPTNSRNFMPVRNYQTVTRNVEETLWLQLATTLSTKCAETVQPKVSAFSPFE